MARAKGSSLALTANQPPRGATITRKQAIEIADAIAKEQYRLAEEQRRVAQTTVEREIGADIGSKVDQHTVDMVRRLMARVAMIAQKARAAHAGSHSYGAPVSSKLPGIVSKIGAIAGELEAIMLTDRAVGLFETVKDVDFVGMSWQRRELSTAKTFEIVDLIETYGEKAQGEIDQVLSQYTLADDEAEKPAKKPRSRGTSPRSQRNVTPPSDSDDDEVDADEIDAE